MIIIINQIDQMKRYQFSAGPYNLNFILYQFLSPKLSSRSQFSFVADNDGWIYSHLYCPVFHFKKEKSKYDSCQ